MSAGDQQRANSYNGDGVLIAQTANGITTRYTHDLARPLSQVLQATENDRTSSYLYGLERLGAVSGSTRMWYAADALGSLRLTLDNAGVPLTTHWYDPWGAPQPESAPAPFGFTGELQDAATGLVYLRDRWYHASQGTLTTQDPYAGNVAQPYSLHPYQYDYSNPLLMGDPSGRTPGLALPWILGATVAAGTETTAGMIGVGAAAGGATLGAAVCVSTVVCAVTGIAIGVVVIGISVALFNQEAPDRQLRSNTIMFGKSRGLGCVRTQYAGFPYCVLDVLLMREAAF